MSEQDAGSPQSGEIAFWNGVGGRAWAHRQESWDTVLAPLSEATLAQAAPHPGERVVDIGCGCGATTIALARLVGPTGRVLGVDVSAPMLARAAERLEPGQPVEFVRADATTHDFAPGTFDLLFSRLGVMFFAEPARAFANLRRALRPGGRLVFCCFRTARENPWMMVPLHAAYEHVPPLPKIGPEDPGPFAFASQERVRHILGAAGFAEIGFTPIDLEFDVGAGRGLAEAVATMLEIGAASRALAGRPAEQRAAAGRSIERALAQLQRGTRIPLAAAGWIVRAISP